jgi:hypothetical protein
MHNAGARRETDGATIDPASSATDPDARLYRKGKGKETSCASSVMG